MAWNQIWVHASCIWVALGDSNWLAFLSSIRNFSCISCLPVIDVLVADSLILSETSNYMQHQFITGQKIEKPHISNSKLLAWICSNSSSCPNIASCWEALPPLFSATHCMKERWLREIGTVCFEAWLEMDASWPPVASKLKLCLAKRDTRSHI